MRDSYDHHHGWIGLGLNERSKVLPEVSWVVSIQWKVIEKMAWMMLEKRKNELSWIEDRINVKLVPVSFALFVVICVL